MDHKKAITRSPSYPSSGLKAAIEKAKVVWNYSKREPVAAEVAAKYWGYGAKSSGWRLALSALKQYGLLDAVDSKKSGRVKLSDLALKIILDTRNPSPERDAAIKEAALRPKSFLDVLTHWDGKLPADDSIIQTYLTLNKGFNSTIVPDFIATIRKTVAFANLTPSDIMGAAGSVSKVSDDTESEDDDGDHRRQLERRPMQPGMKEDVFNLEEGPVILQWPERLSQESFDDFESWLQLVIRKAKRSVGPWEQILEKTKDILTRDDAKTDRT